MKRLLLIVYALFLSACALPSAPSLSVPTPSGDRIKGSMYGQMVVWHDDQRNVTCWIYEGYSTASNMVCMTDAEIRGE